MEISERWAQELAFYLKNKEIDMGMHTVRAMGSSVSGLQSFVPDDKTSNGHHRIYIYEKLKINGIG